MISKWLGASSAVMLAVLTGCGGGAEAPAPAPTTEVPPPTTPESAPPPPDAASEMSPQLAGVLPKIPADQKDKANPKAGDAAAISKGKETFTTVCASCHGPEGKGDGPAAAALTPKPFNFTHAARLTAGQRFWVMKNGIEGTGMSAFGAAMDDDTIWSVLAYADTLAGGSTAPAAPAGDAAAPPAPAGDAPAPH